MKELSAKQDRERRQKRAAYMRAWRADRKAAEERYEAWRAKEAANTGKPWWASAKAGRG